MRYLIFTLLLTCSVSAQVSMPFAFWQSPAGGGGVGPLPVTDSLYARFRADSTLGLTVSGDTSYVWPDVSGNDYHVYMLTDSKKPTYWGTSDSTYPSFKFDGVDDEFNIAGGVYPVRAQPNTVIVVAKTFFATGTHTLTDGESAQNAVYQNSTTWALFAGSAMATGATANVDSVYILSARFNGASSSLRSNGLDFAGAVNPGVQGNGISIGNGPVAAFPSNCNIYEVLIYDGLLTDSEISQVETYLANRWGVTLP